VSATSSFTDVYNIPGHHRHSIASVAAVNTLLELSQINANIIARDHVATD
jgi:hypothetical protein